MNSVDAAVTYAIGDLHGEVTLLKKLLTILPLRQQDTLVFLGDYMDRGEDSIATVLTLIELQHKHLHCIFIRGNHDDAWLDKWDGLHFQGPSDCDGSLDLWDDCAGQIPFAVGDWLEQTAISYEDAYAYYVHGGFLPGRSSQNTPDSSKMWGARGFLESTYDWGKPVVFGHYVCSEPLLQPNKIGVDTGAYKSGVLTAVRLPDRSIFQAHRE
jgi:serine/threonine protein phosphatase 1